jgi:hypothetical protein
MMTTCSEPQEVDAFLLPRAPGALPYYLRQSTPLELKREDMLRRVFRAEAPAAEPLPGCTPEQAEIHRCALARVQTLVEGDPAPDSDDGRELLALVAVVEFYERGCMPRSTGSAG